MALTGAFQFDDWSNVVRDPATTNGAALLERLTHGLRPLTRLSYFADAHVYGMRATGFLATNLALHVATALLVFALARRRLAIAAALIAALVFALQPANGEVVAYVSGRSTGLMTPLVLAALVLHDRDRRVGALACFTLACLAKEVALVFPALVLVWDASSGASWRDVVRRAAPYAITAVVMTGVLLLAATYRARLTYSLELRSMTDSLVANGRAVPRMLALWFRPDHLSVDHDFAPTGHAAAGIAGIVALGAIVVTAIALRRRAPVLALALAWPIIALLPTSSVIAKLDLVTEKPLYLAWVGPAIVLGGALATGPARRAVAAALVVTMTALAIWRARVWSDPIRLWQEATAHAPMKARCWNNLGMAYQAAGRDADAARAFGHAFALDPTDETARLNVETARILGDTSLP